MHSISQRTSSFSEKGAVWIGVKFPSPAAALDLCCSDTGQETPANIHEQEAPRAGSF